MRTKKLYVVGFYDKEGFQTALYSYHAWGNSVHGGGIEKMTLAHAKRHLKELGGFKGTIKAIYKLVPVYKQKIK